MRPWMASHTTPPSVGAPSDREAPILRVPEMPMTFAGSIARAMLDSLSPATAMRAMLPCTAPWRRQVRCGQPCTQAISLRKNCHLL